MTEQPRNDISRRALLRNAGLAGAGLASMAAAPAVHGGLADVATSATTNTIGDTLDALRLAKVFAEPDQHHLLGRFDDTHVVHDDGAVEILLWPGDLARLRETGLRFELLDTPMERHVAESQRQQTSNAGLVQVSVPGETESGDYRTLQEYNDDMRALAEAYPDRCKLVTLPHRTLERRAVLGLEICDDVERYDGRPVYYNDGLHHAREFPAGEVPIMWAYELLEAEQLDDGDPLGAARKQRLLTIRQHVRNVIVPVVNADGFNWAREAVVDTTDPVGSLALSIAARQAYWRKNRRAYLGTHQGDPFFLSAEEPNPYDAYGIDNNRNYGFGWGGDGSGVTFEDQTYRGAAPFSEQETKNVVHLFEKYMCLGAITHHTSGDLILWAWGDTRDDAPDNDLLEGIGRAMAEYNGYRPQKSIDLYVTTGTASDYMYGSRASISYTFEHAGSSFHPSYPDTVPAMYERNRDALMFLCEQSCLVPSLRPDYDDSNVLTPEAKLKMAEQGVALNQLNHAIIRGDAGTRATVRISKRYPTQLWVQDYDNGNTGADNPLGQPSVEEVQDCEFRTAPDGTFQLHVAPSTQPKVEFLGRTEAYDITVLPDDGSPGYSVRRVIRRGQVIDL